MQRIFILVAALIVGVLWHWGDRIRLVPGGATWTAHGHPASVVPIVRVGKRASFTCEFIERSNGTETGHPALVSFPELRRCMLGNWPLPPTRSSSYFSFEDALSCVCRLAAQRSDGMIRNMDVCQPNDEDPTKFDLFTLMRAYSQLATERMGRSLTSEGGSPLLRFMYHTGGSGGLGDHIRGLTESLFLALASNPPRALVIDDSSWDKPPLNLTWTECPGRDSYRWKIPLSWNDQLANETFKFRPQLRFNTSPPSGGAHNDGWNLTHLALDITNMHSAAVFDRIVSTVTNSAVPLISMADNMIRRSALQGINATAALRWYRELHRRNSSYWPALSTDCGGVPWEWGIIDRSRAASCLASLRPPRVFHHSDRWDAITAAIHPLFDRLFWPSSALLDLVVRRVIRHYRPGKQFVIAVHLRVGTPAANSSYNDPPRNDLLQSVPAIAICGQMVLDQLKAVYGEHEALWYVATDRPDAVPLLRSKLPGKVITLGISSVTHTHQSHFPSAQARDMGFLESYADHFLLSTAHAMIASPSGFSATARFWGRIPESIGWSYKNFTVDAAAKNCLPNDYR